MQKEGNNQRICRVKAFNVEWNSPTFKSQWVFRLQVCKNVLPLEFLFLGHQLLFILFRVRSGISNGTIVGCAKRLECAICELKISLFTYIETPLISKLASKFIRYCNSIRRTPDPLSWYCYGFGFHPQYKRFSTFVFSYQGYYFPAKKKRRATFSKPSLVFLAVGFTYYVHQ